MGDLYRVRSVWTGFLGGPGVSTMYFVDVATAVNSVDTFWRAIADRLPEDVHIQVENAGDVIDDATGDLTDSWSSDATEGIDGTAAGSYSAPAGIVVDWLTATVLDGRRVRGRTFIVPMSAGGYDTNGTPSAAFITDIQNAADELVLAQSSSFYIWHRPGGGHPGGSAQVTSAHVPDFTAVLRSRRD